MTESELLSLEAKGARYLGDHSVALDRLTRAVELTCTPRDEASYRAYLSATAADAGERELAANEGVRALDLLKSTVASPRLVGTLAVARTAVEGVRSGEGFAARYDALAKSTPAQQIRA